MPAQERLSWEAAGPAILIPQQWKSTFVRDRVSSQAEKGVAVSGREVCSHDVAAPMPHPCTEQMEVNVNSVLWVTLVRGGFCPGCCKYSVRRWESCKFLS